MATQVEEESTSSELKKGLEMMQKRNVTLGSNSKKGNWKTTLKVQTKKSSLVRVQDNKWN